MLLADLSSPPDSVQVQTLQIPPIPRGRAKPEAVMLEPASTSDAAFQWRGNPEMGPVRYSTLLAVCLASCATQGATTNTSHGPDAAGAGSSSVPATAPFWVYRNGSFNWEGDYSWLAQIDYRDTKGMPPGHRYDIAVRIVGKWGGFQPFAPGKRFDVSRYKYLVYSVKPTAADQVFGTAFAAINDVADGKAVTVTGPPYGPAPVAGQWATYKIPLSEFALTNKLIQKFTIADGTGLPSNLFYVDDVHFTAE
jgi:hypothetical protein